MVPTLEDIGKGIRDPFKAVQYLRANMAPYFSGVEISISSRFPIGDNVLDEEWDLLLILDTCRLDAIKEIKSDSQYPWLTESSLQSRFSIGGSTLEWTAQTFRSGYEEQAANVNYIAGNLLVEEVLDGRRTPEEIADADWSPTAWNILSKSELNEFISVGGMREVTGPAPSHEDRPHPSAELVTDLAIEHGREADPDRLIVHYIQPHYPYYSAFESSQRETMEDWERFPFPHLRNSSISRNEVWDRYMKELKSGLDAIDSLLCNYDADGVVITSDHGEAFGERYFGMKGYKHRAGMLHQKVRRVPWISTTAEDTRSKFPDLNAESNEKSREEMLEALGYI